MKMQDRIDDLVRELGVQSEELRAARDVLSDIDDEALAISSIEAVVLRRLKRSGYLRSDQDKIDRTKLVRVFQFVADRHGVDLQRHI